MAASPSFTITGAAGSLLLRTATAAEALTATLDNLAGVTSVLWEVSGTDDTGGTYTLMPSGSYGSTVAWTAGAYGTAGKLKVTVNGGVNPQTGNVDPAMSAEAKWSVPTAAGLHVGVVGEDNEHDPTYGWTSIVNAAVRASSSAGVFGPRNPVRGATTTTLPANGKISGTLVASANASINGTGAGGLTDWALYERILVKDEAAGENNGVYYWSDLGSASTPWVLTRSDDANTDALCNAGLKAYVQEGTLATTEWVLVTTGVVLDTTALVFKQMPSVPDKALIDAATASATNGTLVLRGASAEASFGALTGTTVTASTELKTPGIDTVGNTNIQVQRNNADIFEVTTTGIKFDTTIAAVVIENESAATGTSIAIRAGTSTAGAANGGTASLSSGTPNAGGTKGSVRLNLSTDNDVMVEAAEVASGRRAVVLCRSSAITTTELPTGSGDLVTYQGNAATRPTAKPVSGVIAYADAGGLAAWTANNLDIVYVPDGGSGSPSVVKVVKYFFETVQTTDATPAVIKAFTLPDNSVSRIDCNVTGQRTDAGGAGDTVGYRVISTSKRWAAGAATAVTGSPTVSPTHEDAGAAAASATINLSGSDIRVAVTGIAGATIEWNVYGYAVWRVSA